MIVSVRFNDNQEKQLEYLKQITGLSTSALIKLRLFSDNSQANITPDLLQLIGALSTTVNIIKAFYNDELLDDQIKIIERGVEKVWQSL